MIDSQWPDAYRVVCHVVPCRERDDDDDDDDGDDDDVGRAL